MRRLLESSERLSILGLDRDEVALAAARQRLARFGNRLMLYHCRFDRLEDAMEAFSVDNLSGALFDLGVSSPQLDEADRGFSYRHDRRSTCMDRTGLDRGRVVNGYPVEQPDPRLAAVRRGGSLRYQRSLRPGPSNDHRAGDRGRGNSRPSYRRTSGQAPSSDRIEVNGSSAHGTGHRRCHRTPRHVAASLFLFPR
jgi:hypothetical protein